MTFPTFTPTQPAFTHWLAREYADRELLVLNDERLTYGELEKRSKKQTHVMK